MTMKIGIFGFYEFKREIKHVLFSNVINQDSKYGNLISSVSIYLNLKF